LKGKPTIRYVSILDERGECIPVINLDLAPYVVQNIPKDDIRDSIRSSFVFYLPNFLINTSEDADFFGELLTEVKKHGTYTIMNLSDPFFARKNRNFVNLAYENGWLDLLVGNRYEFEEFDVDLTKYKIPVIITRDKEGSVIVSDGEYHEIPSFDVNNEDVKDATGAGDYFVAGLIKCLYERNSFDIPVIIEGCRYGSHLAAKIIQTLGTDLGLETG
jgi:sugar/nucleoside kinase (ribokinase family)